MGSDKLSPGRHDHDHECKKLNPPLVDQCVALIRFPVEGMGHDVQVRSEMSVSSDDFGGYGYVEYLSHPSRCILENIRFLHLVRLGFTNEPGYRAKV